MKVFCLLFLLLSLYSCDNKDEHKLEILNSFQFADPEQTYLSNVHLGFYQYRAQSLHGTKKIVLTFDDGPDEVRTPELLNLLKREKIQATFFVLGHKINEKTKPILRRILSEGHQLASHDDDHQDSNTESALSFEQELRNSFLKIEKLEEEFKLLQNESYYRFPYGAYGKAPNYHHFETLKDVGFDLYNENCLNFVFWDIDTVDWLSDMRPLDISQNIISNIIGGKAYRHVKKNGSFVKESYTITKPLGGGVVLLHDVHDRTIEAMKIFLQEIKKHQIEVIKLSEVKEFDYEDKVCELL
jgi:peptidoglycan-N-acetylglucosamine deacetylase